MFAWEELEWQVGGRIKSVLLLVLATFVIVLQGEIAVKDSNKYLETSGDVYQEEVQKNIENTENIMFQNPIDIYFQSQNFQENSVGMLIYLECWEQELSNAYQLLGQAAENWAAVEYVDVEMLKNSFLGFIKEQGILEAYMELQSIYKDKAEEASSMIFASDEVSILDSRQKIDMIRNQTIRIYKKLLSLEQGKTDSAVSEELVFPFFVFEEAEAEKMLKNSGFMY